jgi:hypothetical protein
MQGDQRVVEEPPPLPRAILDDVQIVGGEDSDPQRPQQVAGPAQRLAVDHHAVASRGLQLSLEE